MEEAESIINRQIAREIRNKMFGELKGSARVREAIAAFAGVSVFAVKYFGYSWRVFFSSAEQRNEFNKKVLTLKKD